MSDQKHNEAALALVEYQLPILSLVVPTMSDTNECALWLHALCRSRKTYAVRVRAQLKKRIRDLNKLQELA